MSNIDRFSCVSLPYNYFTDVRKIVLNESQNILYLTYGGTASEVLAIPLQRNKKPSASNIVENWMNDIIEIIEKGEKNSSRSDTIMSEIKAYCKSVITTVTSE